MDKRDNLIRFDQMSPERHKELSSAGGKKAAENKRKMKSMQEMLSCMLEAEVPTKQKAALKKEFGDAVAGVAPRVMGLGPIPAVEKLCAKLGLKPADFDVVE